MALTCTPSVRVVVATVIAPPFTPSILLNSATPITLADPLGSLSGPVSLFPPNHGVGSGVRRAGGQDDAEVGHRTVRGAASQGVRGRHVSAGAAVRHGTTHTPLSVRGGHRHVGAGSCGRHGEAQPDRPRDRPARNRAAEERRRAPLATDKPLKIAVIGGYAQQGVISGTGSGTVAPVGGRRRRR